MSPPALEIAGDLLAPVRIRLDESLPRPLTRLLTGHIVSTVAREGWTSLTNGALLRQRSE